MRSIVNVGTGRYARGSARLRKAVEHQCTFRGWSELLPEWPSHQQKPYAFKAYGLERVAGQGFRTLLWCDSCILPVKDLDPLFEQIERDGYWIARNGWNNYEWTADSAYPDLFPACTVTAARKENRRIPHVVATAFGVCLDRPIGWQIYSCYLKLAKETNAFCGPWTNANFQERPLAMRPPMNERCQPCGLSDVRGHRHDQTALSVIAWRLGCQLTDPPNIFAYRGGETDGTILVADGSY